MAWTGTRLLCAAAMLLGLAIPAALAQSESGLAAITGRVADASGGAIAGATIKVTETQTGQTRTLKSDAAGLYSIPSLAVGEYSVVGSAAGFGDSSVELNLAVGQTAEINLALKPGNVATAVTVSADDITDITHRTETDNSTVLGSDVVENLPTRGRNFTDFALLTPGISQELDRFGLVVNGQRSGNSNISLDGVDFNDPLQNGQRGGSAAAYFFPQVAVREFQVVRTGASAEIGRTNAGFVNVVTKSGTNRLHGEGIYTNRNPWLTWPDALNDPEATNNQNQFAFGVGGPILKDKLFFYAGVEKTWFEVPFFVRVGSNCPTASYYDPNNFPQDTACSQANNPGTQALPAQFASLETNSYGLNSPLASSGRLDWQVNPKNSAMLQYMSTFLSNVAFGVEGISQASVSNNTSYAQQSQGIVLGLTTVLGSNRTNEAHVQWVYDNRQQVPNSTGPEIDISDFLNIGGTGAGTFIYRAIREELVDNYSWLLGRHSLRFGVDINLEPETQQREANPNGLWTVDTFADYLTALPVSQGGLGTSTPAAINAANMPCGGGEVVNPPGTNPRISPGSACPFQFQQTIPYNGGPLPRYIATQREFAGYLQDNFHATDRITLNLGFRYDAQLEPAAPVNPAVAGTGVDPSDVTMFAPRFGIAWDTRGDGSTVVRASTGLFDARTPGYLLQHTFTDNGMRVASIDSDYQQSLLAQAYSSNSGYGVLGSIPAGTNILNDIYTNNSGFRNPRSMQIALAIDQRVTKRVAFTVSGTQQETWKLQHRLDTNLFQPIVDPTTLYPVFPSINPITNVTCETGGVSIPCRPNGSIAGFHENYSTAHATYRSLIGQIRGNFTKHLTGMANFTWASSRDDDSNERDADRELALDPLCTACYNRGYSKQDIRNQFNLNGVYRLPYRFIFSSSFIARTALPYTAVTSGAKQGDLNNDGNKDNDRPILCSQVPYTVCPVSSTQFNAYKGGAEVGVVAGRNTFRQDGFLNWDMRMIKEFRIEKGQQLQFSAECLNCSRASNLNLGANEVSKFTHAQSTMNLLTGYYYSGGSAGKMTDAYDTFRSGGPRQIQLGARYLF
jgi:Carboxypeptidase regulatory-like domain/TonB dependent receptor